MLFGDPRRLRSGPHWEETDLYIDYEFDQVMFRWDCKEKKVYRKFYGSSKESIVPESNKLWTEARCDGNEITRTEYVSGKPKDERFLNRI